MTARVYSSYDIVAPGDGEVAEENMNVLVCPYHLHRKPEVYDNPLTFNPDHFLPENVQKRHPYAYLPFSAGPRGCLGRTNTYPLSSYLHMTSVWVIPLKLLNSSNCVLHIGTKFAMLSMKTMLATILREYRFTTEMKMEDIEYDLEVVLRSVNGWKVKIHTRH